MSGSTSEVMPVEGEEMVETAEVAEDPMLNLFQQNNSLNNDQAITTLFAQQEPQGIMAAKGGLTNYLKENAPKGEFLAYINPDEATMLKKAGGSGKLVNGIPSFEPRSSREADQKSSNPVPVAEVVKQILEIYLDQQLHLDNMTQRATEKK